MDEHNDCRAKSPKEVLDYITKTMLELSPVERMMGRMLANAVDELILNKPVELVVFILGDMIHELGHILQKKEDEEKQEALMNLPVDNSRLN